MHKISEEQYVPSVLLLIKTALEHLHREVPHKSQRWEILLSSHSTADSVKFNRVEMVTLMAIFLNLGSQSYLGLDNW